MAAPGAADRTAKRFDWERAINAHRVKLGLTSARHHVLVVLASHATKKSTARIGVAKLVEITGYGEKTVRRAIEAATDAGLVVRIRKGHRLGDGRVVCSIYRLELPEWITSSGQGSPDEP